jgi:O-antigen ligase
VLSIVASGSRGGLLALGAGLAVFMTRGHDIRIKIRNSIAILTVIGLLLVASSLSQVSKARWEETYQSGDVTGRDRIWSEAWGMFKEKPLMGWGPVYHLYELGRRTGDLGWEDETQEWRDTHNLVLYILTQTGLLGALPFFIGIWLCLKAAWKARSGPQSILPLSMMATLFIVNTSGTWVWVKLHWFILAYALASASQLGVMRLRVKRTRENMPTGFIPALNN